jgi:hypothetical protein
MGECLRNARNQALAAAVMVSGMSEADIRHNIEQAGGVGQAIRNADAMSPTVSFVGEAPAHHGFGHVLQNLKFGNRAARAGWNGKGMYIELQRPDKGSKMTQPYIFMKTVQNDLIPWLASQSDMLADDWAIIPQDEPRQSIF